MLFPLQFVYLKKQILNNYWANQREYDNFVFYLYSMQGEQANNYFENLIGEWSICRYGRRVLLIAIVVRYAFCG